MIYKLISTILVVNLLFEMIENIFPIKNMKIAVQFFSKILVVYLVCKMIFNVN